MTVCDLFAGIGGFSKGLEQAGMTVKCQVEIDPYAIRVLEKHWPNVKRFTDIRQVEPSQIGPVDLVCGGFPCQPFSSAARGRNILEKDLRAEFTRIIAGLRPRYVLAENVTRRAIREFAQTVGDIGGYRTTAFDLSADEIGADHQRNRWWLVAYPDNEGKFLRRFDAEMAKLPKVQNGLWGWANYARAIRVSNGVSNRTHRLRALGNAVVPAVVERIGRAIMEASK